MMKMRKILAPTDLSDLSVAGLRYAAEIAADSGGEVIIFHVIGYPEALPVSEGMKYDVKAALIAELMTDHREQLERFLRRHRVIENANVKVRQDVVVGSPYKMILAKAAEERVDGIVLSTHGRSGIAHALLGSVAEKIVRYATCPVLTVRAGEVKAQSQISHNSS